ncbi:hypothetical protein PsorP6_012273 [Peronosclerospora sorghi]|uniref:Uncharacterized protein n=1 Tax=Peronosclerospora sorghi TaxID=230839 RepID=A0ACC0WK28_9STRA|nr:hypothetical protein PsorP6_012273 [Peronosclerospora sorghi]
MVNFLELLLLAVLLGVPCGIILPKSAVNPSLFVLHPALNAIAFLLCFPLGIYVMQERKSVMDFKTRLGLYGMIFRCQSISLSGVLLWTDELLSKLHMFFQVVAMLLLSLGGTAAYIKKNAFGKEHFTSTHSWLAVGTATLATLSLLGVS